MYSSNQTTKVMLFPLCDVHGVLIDTLCDTSDGPNTRTDALVFAWRLALPKGMDISQAAEALLIVALNTPRKSWSDQQLLIVRELMALAGRTASVPGVGSLGGNKKQGPQPKRRARDNSVDIDLCEDNGAVYANNEPDIKPVNLARIGKAPKESKKWWKLVGPDPD